MTAARVMMRALSGMALLLPASALAQGGRIEGVVFDSLRMRPLSGAAVWSQTASRATVADSLGRFALDSLPAGQHFLLAADPALDSLGILVSGIATATDARTTRVTLASPAIRTLARRLCAPTDSLPDGTGILFGSVRNAATGELVPNALVNITWLSLSGEGDRAIPELAAARPLTDSLGTFAVCGIPVDTALRVVAQGGELGSSGTLYLSMGELRALRTDLYLSTGSERGDGAVRGFVADSANRRLDAVSVRIDGTTLEARTNDRGEFFIGGAPVGSRTLVVRRPGFAPAYISTVLTPSDTPYVAVNLGNVRMLNTVEIRAERLTRTMQQVAQRRQTGFGYHRSAEQLQRESSIHALLRSTPGVRVQQGRMAGDYYYFGAGRSIHGGPCMLSVFIDGVKSGPEMLYLFDVKQLLAVEVYPRGEQVPAAFSSRTGGCGAILVWTAMMQ